MKSSQNLPAKLKEYRKKNHYSQEQLAEQMNLSRQAISNWETGKATPDIDNLVMLSELYGTPVDVLLGEENPDGKVDNTAFSINNNAVLEMLGLAVVLILSLNIPCGGILTSIFTIYWLKNTKRDYRIIYIICVVCFCVSLHEIIALCSHIWTQYGTTRLEIIE